jgi:predicted Zn-dependent protease
MTAPRRFSGLSTRVRAWCLSLGAAVLLTACGTPVVNPVTGETEYSAMDESAEVETGRKQHEQILQEYGVYADTKVQAYVNEVGQKLAAQSHRPQLTWTFTVLDSTEINAFALPGGYVYITRGIMAYLDSEAELAGVLGHEIGHVCARHGAQRATQQQRAGLGVLAATVLGAVLEANGVSRATDLASQVSQTAAAGYIASYSRDQESQADALGAEYLARNRYNPRNMVDVIRVLQNQERFAADMAKAQGKAAPSGPNWLASHPSNDQRLADIVDISARYVGQYGDDQRPRYIQTLEGMTFGESREQGVTRGRHYYHEGLGFALTAPVGWEIDNSPSAITLVNGAGDAALVVRVVPPKYGSTPQEVIRQVLKPTDGQTEARSLHGLQALHFEGRARNSQGQTSSVMATVAKGPGGQLFLMQYLAKDAAARQRALAALTEAEASFRPLGAADRAAARPWVLRMVPYPKGGFAELARTSPLQPQPEARLKLINGAYGDGPQPGPGQKVKTVQ